MTTVRFGTDGIRGIAGETLTVEIAAALGAALMQQHPAGLVLLGRDTRPSGAALASALVIASLVATPVVAAGRVFVGAFDGRVSAYDAGVGEKLWSFETGAPVSASPVSDGALVLVSSRSYDVYALDAITGEPRWNRYLWYSWIESTPVLQDGMAWFGSSDASKVFAVELRTGRSRWEADVRGISWTTPAVTLDRVYAAVRHSPSIAPHEGSLLALDRETGTLLKAGPLLLDGEAAAALGALSARESYGKVVLVP